MLEVKAGVSNSLISKSPNPYDVISSRYVVRSKTGTLNIIASTRMITHQVVKSESFLPTFDSSGTLYSSFFF